MRRCSSSSVLLLALLAFILAPAMGAERAPGFSFDVEPGRMIFYSGGSSRSILIDGVIIHQFRCDEGVYYLASDGESSNEGWRIGFIDGMSGEKRFEKTLPRNISGAGVKKFIAGGGIAYILALSSPDGVTGTLYRLNMNDMEVSGVPDVADFHVDGEETVLLMRNDEGGFSVTMNNFSVPLSLETEGRLSIRAFLDGRIVFVTNGEGTELIDLIGGGSLYQYHPGRNYLPPDEYNLAIQAIDETGSGSGMNEMIFYKIYINGVESGRTDTGPAGLNRRFQAHLEANQYHLLALERWVLNPARGRYDRANNIHQPKTQKIYIPRNRTVGIRLIYEGGEYRYTIVPVYK